MDKSTKSHNKLNVQHIDSNIRKLQLVEVDILKEIVKICDDNNLRYFLLGGTFLGAVRHKGFIPWDDDIDIGLPRPDYEKLFKIIYKQLPKNLNILNYKAGEGYFSYIPKIINKSLVVKNNSRANQRLGYAWIDIFPIDGMPNNLILRKMHQLNLLTARLFIKYSRFSDVAINLKERPFIEKILIHIGKMLPVERMFNKDKSLERLDRLLKKYSYDSSNYVVNFMGAYKFKEMFPKKIYDKIQKYQFEDMKLTAPKNYDYVLKQMYGNYMKIPPKEMRNKHFTSIAEVKETNNC